MSYNSVLLIPASNVASPIVTPVIPVGSPMVVPLQVEAAPSPSLYLSRTSSHECLHGPPPSQSFPQPYSALYLPQLSSALSPPHPCHPCAYASLLQPPSLQLYIIGSPSRCPLCSSNSSNNRAKVGFKRRLRRLLGRQC